MTETLANGYSSESTQRELSNEYQHDRVSMVFKDFSVLVLWTNVASALEGFNWAKDKHFLYHSTWLEACVKVAIDFGLGVRFSTNMSLSWKSSQSRDKVSNAV